MLHFFNFFVQEAPCFRSPLKRLVSSSWGKAMKAAVFKVLTLQIKWGRHKHQQPLISKSIRNNLKICRVMAFLIVSPI